MKKSTANLTVEEVKRLLDYCCLTGRLFWKVDRNHKTKAVHVAGHRRADGYVVLKINGHNYLAHHLAWVITYSAWPERLDHRNADPSDNRIYNLREATQSENVANGRIRSTNTSGFKGAYFDKRDGRWFSSIKIDGKNKSLGTFATAEEAHEAYVAAAKSIFGEFARAA